MNDLAAAGSPSDDGAGRESKAPVVPKHELLDPEISFVQYVEQRRAKEEADYEENARRPSYADHLVSAFRTYTTTEIFEPGVLVQWKPQMRSQRFPQYGFPAVVVGYLPEPQTRDKDGDPLVEPSDIILGILEAESDFRVFVCPSRRLTLWSDD